MAGTKTQYPFNLDLTLYRGQHRQLATVTQIAWNPTSFNDDHAIRLHYFKRCQHIKPGAALVGAIVEKDRPVS